MTEILKTSMWLLCILAISNVIGQKTFPNPPEWNNSTMTISYYGDYITNPGLQVSYERALMNKVVTKSKLRRGKGTTKYKTHRIELVPNFAFYQDPNSHTALIPNLTIQYKKINHHRWLMTVGLGGGLFGNMIQNNYEVTGNSVLGPNTVFTAYPSASVHWSFGRVKNSDGKMKGMKIGLVNHVLFNFNNSFQFAPAINLGYSF